MSSRNTCERLGPLGRHRELGTCPGRTGTGRRGNAVLRSGLHAWERVWQGQVLYDSHRLLLSCPLKEPAASQRPPVPGRLCGDLALPVDHGVLPAGEGAGKGEELRELEVSFGIGTPGSQIPVVTCLPVLAFFFFFFLFIFLGLGVESWASCMHGEHLTQLS